jgi:hypothetical protein
MFLSDELRKLVLTAPAYAKDILLQAADQLEDQRMWKQAWVKALLEIEELTTQNISLQSATRRKEKEEND